MCSAIIIDLVPNSLDSSSRDYRSKLRLQPSGGFQFNIRNWIGLSRAFQCETIVWQEVR